MIVSVAKAQEAAEVLGITTLDGLTTETVNRAFRDKAKGCHPDHHGITQLEQWSKVSWAKEVLCGWVEKHPPEQTEINDGETCRNCQGEGRIKVRSSGFGKPLTVQCSICRGNGTISKEENDADWS